MCEASVSKWSGIALFKPLPSTVYSKPGVFIRNEILPRDWHRSRVGLVDDMIKTLKSIKMRLIYIHEISEGCVRIAVPAVSNFKFVTQMIFLLDLF